VDERGDLPAEGLGHGGVHHVAFRVPTDEEHGAWLDRLETAGFRTSGLVDRYYFHSIYFREPGGALFEIATDGPGFAADEPEEMLGSHLALPPFLEGQRERIEAGLVPLA
jgi:glyoxalase family protein